MAGCARSTISLSDEWIRRLGAYHVINHFGDISA